MEAGLKDSSQLQVFTPLKILISTLLMKVLLSRYVTFDISL